MYKVTERGMEGGREAADAVVVKGNRRGNLTSQKEKVEVLYKLYGGI